MRKPNRKSTTKERDIEGHDILRREWTVCCPLCKEAPEREGPIKRAYLSVAMTWNSIYLSTHGDEISKIFEIYVAFACYILEGWVKFMSSLVPHPKVTAGVCLEIVALSAKMKNVFLVLRSWNGANTRSPSGRATLECWPYQWRVVLKYHAKQHYKYASKGL